MVNDFLPPRKPKQFHGAALEPDKTITPGNISASDERPPVSPSPQLTRAQPFLRPGQPTNPNTTSPSFDNSNDTADMYGPALNDVNNDPAQATPPPSPSKQSPFTRCKNWWQHLPRKKKIILSVLAALIAIGLCVGAYCLLMSDPAPQKATTKKQAIKKAPPKPVITYSSLTGLPVDPSVNQRPVTGVMIENSLDARPQAGLNDAGVVFEAIAEGGITRFLALFQDTEPEYIGPVRSVRPYYIQWGAAFNAAIAHVGGSAEALQAMKDWNIRDLDQFAGGPYFWRINTRFAPHNVYTSIAKLREYENKKGYGAAPYTGLARKEKEVKPAAGTVPKARIIDLAISGITYNAHYDYDVATNSYLRKEGGAAHTDDKSGKQLAPKVVVALVMPYSLQANRIHSVYQTLGSGKAYIFQDGDVLETTWHKADRNAQFTFTDAANQAVKLNPGQTWITAVSAANAVTYAP